VVPLVFGVRSGVGAGGLARRIACRTESKREGANNRNEFIFIA